MGNEADQSVVGFVKAFGIVAGIALAVMGAAIVVLRASNLSVIPKWATPRTAWPGGIVIGLFLAYYVAMPAAMLALERGGVYQRLHGPAFPPMTGKPPAGSDPATVAKWSGENQLRAMWASFLVVPLLVGLTVYLRATVLALPTAPAGYLRLLPNRVVIGVWFGLMLVPLTFALHGLTIWVAEQSGVELDRHPLTDLTPAGDGYGGVVFALSVIVVGPLVEELLFRGLVINWAIDEWHRPWLVMVFAGVLASLRGTRFLPEFGPTVFLALLAIGLYLVQRFAFHLWPRFPTRAFAAVWSSAALFAAAHTAIWPTPIPLFALGLGLGLVTVLTRDISSAVVVHGMFNAVSFVYLLRGGS